MFELVSLVLLCKSAVGGLGLLNSPPVDVNALAQKVDALERELNTLKASTGRLAPQAFMVRLSQNVKPGHNQPIIYNKVLVNLDNNYDPRHGTFTAKINGTYLFSVEACSAAGHFIHLAILKNNVEMGTVLGGDGTYSACSSNTFIFPLVEKDDVWVQHKTGGNLLAVNRNGNNFAGVLIHPA